MTNSFDPPTGALITDEPLTDDFDDHVDADEPTSRHPDAIVTGLSAVIADRLGLDALWVRLAFVLLTLVGGLGLIVYLGLWLVLVIHDGDPADWARVLGGLVLLGGVPLMIANGDLDIMSGPVAMIALLGGLALALWRTRPDAERVVTERAAPLVESSFSASSAPRRPPRARQAPSVLGQLALALAVIVAAGGALIDELNGGRLHPEQWLGAAAVVCGAGLVVGAVLGHARWLIVPALLCAAAGYGGGLLARAGVGVDNIAGDRYLYVNEGSQSRLTSELGFGSTSISISDVPQQPTEVDVRMAAGTIRVYTIDDVAVEIRIDLDDDVTVRGNVTSTSGDSLRLGPERAPDVVINATLLRGMIEIFQMPRDPQFDEIVGSDGAPALDQVISIYEGVGVTRDGWLVLGDREAILNSDLGLITGQGYPLDESTFIVETSWGEYRIIGDVLLTPDRQVFSLAEIRGQLTSATETTALEVTVPTLAEDAAVTEVREGSTEPSLTTLGEG